MAKEDHDPLFGPGRHLLTEKMLYASCVSPFNSPRRGILFDRFRYLLKEIFDHKIVAEIWVNGSFLTRKEYPSDIDVSVMVRQSMMYNLSEEALLFLERIDTAAEKYRDLVDVYVAQIYDNSEEIVKEDDPYRWAEMWGIEHNQYWTKGFAVLNTGDTDAGFLVCSSARSGASVRSRAYRTLNRTRP